MTVGTLMTADDLLRHPDDGWRYELVRGELQKMSPTGARHGEVAAQLVASLVTFVNRQHLGKVYSSESGFKIACDPDTVRAPDAAFVRVDRVVRTSTFFDGAPDAAFEVISPSDSYTEVEERRGSGFVPAYRSSVSSIPKPRPCASTAPVPPPP
jgi:Uma2 family endonuclease